jgi:hypothetical protein
VHFDDFSAHPSGFRIPADVIADLERFGHGPVLVSSKKPTRDARSASI